MTTTQDKQVARHQLLKGALGVVSVALLVLTVLRFTGSLTVFATDSMQYSVQLCLVALVILFSVATQRSGDMLRKRFADRVEAAKEANEELPAPAVFMPAGAEYERAVKQYKVVAWSAVILIASSFVLVPVIGDKIISSGAPFEAFNGLMISAAIVVIGAAVASKYFSWKMRKACIASITQQQESTSL